MKCEQCGRDNLSQKELVIHKKYFHATHSEQSQRIAAGVCPDCGSTLFYQEGCASCKSCGFSKCG